MFLNENQKRISGPISYVKQYSNLMPKATSAISFKYTMPRQPKLGTLSHFIIAGTRHILTGE